MSVENSSAPAGITKLDGEADSEARLVDVDATMAGDLESFGELMNRYGRRVLRLAQKITKNEADAEDVVQDSFMRVFIHLGSFHRRSKFSTWLTRIAINESIRKIRRRSRETSLDTPLNSDEIKAFHETPASGPSPEQTSSYREERELVRRTMSRIRPQNQNLLRLHLYQECSYAQIAQLLGISNSTVRGRIYRARLDLRKALDIAFPTRQKRLRTTIAAPVRKKNHTTYRKVDQ